MKSVPIGTKYEPFYKRPLDVAVLIGAYLILSPLWLLIWSIIPLLIWLEDRGPVFYKQVRAGKGRRPITVVKFRTMVTHADKQGPSWTTENDPRITRVGKILRRTALDELPETWNIWKGDMSFVGPRALALDEQQMLESEIKGFAQRLGVRPGLTGLAQVFDAENDNHGKLRYDLEYIKNMSVWLDLKLLILSVRNTIFGRWDTRHSKRVS